MPIDSPKSVVYRSLFSCDDPKGVAECKTARKSKPGSQKLEGMISNKKKLKKMNVSISYNQLRKETVSQLSTHECHDPSSSIHLREISRGAQRLIDTWSKGISFNRKSKDIAQDLLRGALDLQESLEMLGKLQDMAKLKRKQKEKDGGGGKLNAAGSGRSSDRFGYDGSRMESHKPPSSADRYSKDCYEELREAIREGLAKQNLLPKSSNEEKAYSDRTKGFNEEKAYFDRTKNSGEEKPCLDRTKHFSEEKPCLDRTKHFSEEKAYLDRRKAVIKEKAYFDRTNSSGEERPYFYRTKSDLSLEFPSTSSDQSSMFHSREFDTSDSSFQWSFEEKAKGPNVVAKLMGLEEHLPKSSLFNPLGNDKSLNYGRPIFDMDLPKPRPPHSSVEKADSQQRTLEELIQTVQFKGLMTSPTIDRSACQKQLSSVSDWRKSLPDDPPPIVIIRPLHVSGSLEEDLHKQRHIIQNLDTKEIIRKLKMKEVVPSKLSNVPKGAMDISELQRKLQEGMSPSEFVSHEKGDKHNVDASTGTDDRAIKLMEKNSSTRLKSSVPAKTKVQMKEVVDEKRDQVQRLATNTRKPTEGDTVETSNDRNSHNTNKIASTSSKKPDIEPNVLDDHISQLKANTPNSLDSPPMAPHSSSTRKKKAKPEKPVSIPASTPLVETESKNEAVQIDPRYKRDHDLSAIKLRTSEEVPASDEINSACGNLDYSSKIESHLSDFTSLVKQRSGAKSTDKSSNRKASNATRNLLLSTPLFLNNVEELFYTNSYQPLASCTTSIRDDRVSADNKLLLDCAKELLENKSFQCTRAAHRLSHVHTNKSKSFVFLDQLVDEVCQAIEDLRGYHRLSGEKFARETLPKVLHKDLWCKGVVNGGWDLGWRSGFTPDEIEKIVVHIEQEILNGILEDMFAEMVS